MTTSHRFGLRERKKERTCRAIVDAAARLFAEKGYDETTVAAIAAEVEIAPRTFFSYFPTKEDVLFADTDERIDIALAAIAARRPEDRPLDVLLRAIERMMASAAFTGGMGGPMSAVRFNIVFADPRLQAAALRRLFRAHTALAAALHQAYPEELDDTAAAAIVGALVGAMWSAALSSLSRGDDLDRLRAELRRAMEIAVRGIAAPPPPPI